jgi:hypothetical protein
VFRVVGSLDGGTFFSWLWWKLFFGSLSLPWGFDDDDDRSWAPCGPIGLRECDWGCWGSAAALAGRRTGWDEDETTPETAHLARALTTHGFLAVARQRMPRKEGHTDTEKPSGCREADMSVRLSTVTWRLSSGRGSPAPDVHLRSEPRTLGRGRDGDGTNFHLYPGLGL